MNEALTHRCKSCENTFTGNYCNHCGEKVLVTSDQSFKSVVNSILLTITFVDTRFIKTLWMVLTTPGTLSRDFSHGKRIKRLSPMSLFFLLNLVYFFFPLIQLFNASLHTQLLSPLSVFYINLITPHCQRATVFKIVVNPALMFSGPGV